MELDCSVEAHRIIIRIFVFNQLGTHCPAIYVSQSWLIKPDQSSVIHVHIDDRSLIEAGDRVQIQASN